MTSILFVISIQLKSYPSREQAVKMLQSKPLQSLFENGLQRIRRKVVAARHLQKQIADHLLDTPNVYYHSTIVDGMNGFFKMYRPQFSAHEIHITADYSLLDDRQYQKLVQTILNIGSSTEKIQCILHSVHSFADLLDILSDAELNTNEMQLLVDQLPMPAFAALLHEYPNDDFMTRECDQLIFHALQKRKNQLTEEEKIELILTLPDGYEII